MRNLSPKKMKYYQGNIAGKWHSQGLSTLDCFRVCAFNQWVLELALSL